MCVCVVCVCVCVGCVCVGVGGGGGIAKHPKFLEVDNEDSNQTALGTLVIWYKS